MGGWIGFLTERNLHRVDVSERKRSLATALGAEIEAFLDLTEELEMDERAEKTGWLAGKDVLVSVAGFVPADADPKSPFPICTSRVSEIGVLDDLAADVSDFYAKAINIREYRGA